MNNKISGTAAEPEVSKYLQKKNIEPVEMKHSCFDLRHFFKLILNESTN